MGESLSGRAVRTVGHLPRDSEGFSQQRFREIRHHPHNPTEHSASALRIGYACDRRQGLLQSLFLVLRRGGGEKGKPLGPLSGIPDLPRVRQRLGRGPDFFFEQPSKEIGWNVGGEAPERGCDQRVARLEACGSRSLAPFEVNPGLFFRQPPCARDVSNITGSLATLLTCLI